MKPIAKIICGAIALAWVPGAMAAEVTVSAQGETIVLESLGGGGDATQSSPAPAAVPDAAPPAQPQPEQVVSPVMRTPVKPYYETVDRANIEKRMEDRAARTKKRKADAEKDAAERAAKAQLNQTPPQDQGAQNNQ